MKKNISIKENQDNSYSLLIKDIKSKKILCIIKTNNQQYEITKDPIFNLLKNMEEINYIRKLNLVNYFFFSRKVINSILYNNDEIIKFETNEKIINLNNSFYLNLLINENTIILNYTYNIDYIKKLNEYKRGINNNEILKKILLSKIILDLIKNYRETDEFDEETDNNMLQEFENENTNIIQNNINIFIEIDLHLNEIDIIRKKIDEIYIDIINSLINNRKIENYGYTINILNQLEIENINITKTMFDSLNNNLDLKKDYIKEYIISNKEDLFNEKKINFNYILLKYILKSSFYIYQIAFLNNSRNLFLKLLKSKELSFNNINNNNSREKIEYILKLTVDLEYYFINKISDKELEQLKEVLEYYKNYLFKSKKEEIKLIERIIESNKGEYQIYLKEYELAKKMNIRKDIITYFYDLKNSSEEDLNEKITKWEKIEKVIVDKKIKKMKNSEKSKLILYFKDENKRKLLLQIFSKDIIDFYINENLNNLNNSKKNKEKSDINKEPNVDQQRLEDIQNKEVKKDISLINDKSINNNKSIKQNKFEQKSVFDSTVQNSSINVKNKENNNDLIEENLGAGAPLLNEMKKDIASLILTNSSFIFHTNEKGKEPFFIYDKIYYSEHHIEISYEKFIESKGNYEKYENGKKSNELYNSYIEFFNFLKEVEKEIRKEYKYNYNLIIKLDFQKEKINDNLDLNLYNITCIYTYYEPNKNKPFIFKEKNILVNKTNSNLQGFKFMIIKMNNYCYKDINYKKLESNDVLILIDNINKNEKNILNNNFKEEIYQNNNIDESTKIQSYIEDSQNQTFENMIIKFLFNIGKHKNSADFIVELKDGYFVSGGCDNSIILYDENYVEKLQIKNLKDWVYSICEKKNLNKKKLKNNIQLLCCTNQDLTSISIDLNSLDFQTKTFEIPKKTSVLCIEMKESNYIIAGQGGVSYYVDLFIENKQVKQSIITEKTYRGGIKINDNVVVLISNKILPKGEDKLIFYNVKTKKVSNNNMIEGFSFIISSNGLSLIPREEVKNDKKILLCACKKYKKNQKNGILLVNPQLGDNKRVINEFYDTDNYEVYCFCPILKIDENEKIEDTNYFLVGGFDEDKRVGMIKLFKIIFGEKAFNSKIEYLQDIDIDTDNEKFIDFDGPITSIIQSKKKGHIIITCYNGNVYLFSKPNLKHYLELEKKKN